MIKSITVTNHLGKSVKLSMTNPWSTGLIITNIDGLGPPKATINTTELAIGDGGIFNSAKASTRNIVFTFRFIEVTDDNGGVAKTIEDVRHDLYGYFPLKNRVTLLFETDTRICRINGYIEEITPVIFSKEENVSLSIICDDPYFYTTSSQSNLNGVNGAFEFPFCNDDLELPRLIFGELVFDVGQSMVYDGDESCGVIFKIHAIGPIKNLTLVNNTTRETMHIDTSKLSAIIGGADADIINSDDLVINTQLGKKSASIVRSGVMYNILPCIPKDSDWIKVVKGDNIFTYSAEYGSTNALITIENNNLYVGI